MVEAVALVSGDTGEGVAVEDGDLLAVACGDASAAKVTIGFIVVRPNLIGLTCVQCNLKCLACRHSIQSGTGGGDVDVGVVFGSDDGKGTGLVDIDDILQKHPRLVEALDDVVVAKALCGQHKRSVEGDIGDVGAIGRDGVGRHDMDGFFGNCAIIGAVVVALLNRDVDSRDAVGIHIELHAPSCLWVGNRTRTVTFGTDKHLVGYPSTKWVLLEPVVHER